MNRGQKRILKKEGKLMMENMNGYHTDSCPSTIVKEWYERGQQEKEAMFKFVSYWIVFNHLYNYNLKDIETSYETGRIRDYCYQHMNVLVDTVDFNASYLDEMKSSPVIPDTFQTNHIDWNGEQEYIEEKLYELLARGRNEDGRLRSKCEYIARDYINICDESAKSRKRIVSLFMTIYRVRCNLFHGMKRPYPGRDYNLVRDSADILERCLPGLIEDTFRRHGR